jgi:response regulator NasT
VTAAGGEEATTGASAGEGAAAEGAPATRVVIAEDEAIIRLDLKEILVSAGFEVVGETGRGDEAIALVDEHRPDLVILDVKMPGMDGVRAAREITARHRAAVLVLTAFSQRELIEEAREAGVAAYLVKPFRREELLPAIEGVLAKCRQDWAIAAEVDELDPAGDEGARAEDKIETRNLVDQAKAVLMDRHAMTEPEAFSFVQRTAMQTRSRMRDVARRVVDGELQP